MRTTASITKFSLIHVLNIPETKEHIFLVVTHPGHHSRLVFYSQPRSITQTKWRFYKLAKPNDAFMNHIKAPQQ